MKRLIVSNNQRGAVLLVTMMILLILTVLGVAAITTTTSELRITANAKTQTLCFYGADGGGRLYEPILKSAIYNRSLTVPSSVVADPSVYGEMMGDPDTDDWANSPDLSTTVGGMTIGLDLDGVATMFGAGGSIEFASGYEGIGASLAGGGAMYEYQISMGCKYGQTRAEISHLYIYHFQ